MIYVLNIISSYLFTYKTEIFRNVDPNDISLMKDNKNSSFTITKSNNSRKYLNLF
jgi:hypothetical protein